MTRPVYSPGVRFDSGGCLGRAVKPVILFLLGGSAAGARPTQRQRGLPVRELGTVGGRDPLNPPVTSTGQKTGCANRNPLDTSTTPTSATNTTITAMCRGTSTIRTNATGMSI